MVNARALLGFEKNLSAVNDLCQLDLEDKWRYWVETITTFASLCVRR